MNRAQPGGWVQTLGMLCGLAAGWQFGGIVGGWILPATASGLLEFSAGFVVTCAALTVLGNIIDKRCQGNPAGTSPVRLWIRGLGLRTFARVIWAGVITAPLAGAYWIFTSGILKGVLP